MRFIPTLAAAIILAAGSATFAQEPKPLTADDLAILKDSVEVLDKAAQDMQTARLFMEASTAKSERASLLFEGRKLRLLAVRGLSPETHEVVYVPGEEGKAGQWLIRPRPKEEKKP